MYWTFLWAALGSMLVACAQTPRSPASASVPELSRDFASRAVALSLHCVDEEGAHYDEGQGRAPHAIRLRHPAFFGCVDWHSAVHGHWAMLRALDTIPDLSARAAIIDALSRHLTPAKIRAEVAFLNSHPDYEEPYGWGWGLRLAQELRLSQLPEAKVWGEAFAPLEAHLLAAIRAYALALRAPNRVGMHENTAFALIHAWDYSETIGNHPLRDFLGARAQALYLADRNCPLASEPGATDFLSPCFVEADLMRRVLPDPEFLAWYARFLPDVRPEQLRPVPPRDLHDPYQVHLVGLMYEKSSAMRGVAGRLSAHDPRRDMLLGAIHDQIEMAGRLMFDSDYGGTHWLASFAIFYYTGVGI